MPLESLCLHFNWVCLIRMSLADCWSAFIQQNEIWLNHLKTINLWFRPLQESIQIIIFQIVEKSQKAGLSASKIKWSTIQNLDYFEIGGGGVGFPKFKLLKYATDFDDIWVRYWWSKGKIWYLVHIWLVYDWWSLKI